MLRIRLRIARPSETTQETNVEMLLQYGARDHHHAASVDPEALLRTLDALNTLDNTTSVVITLAGSSEQIALDTPARQPTGHFAPLMQTLRDAVLLRDELGVVIPLPATWSPRDQATIAIVASLLRDEEVRMPLEEMVCHQISTADEARAYLEITETGHGARLEFQLLGLTLPVAGVTVPVDPLYVVFTRPHITNATEVGEAIARGDNTIPVDLRPAPGSTVLGRRHRPRIKRPHYPVLHRSGTIRLGGAVPGIRSDVVDHDGRVWRLLELLDGTRDESEIISALATDNASAAWVRAVISDLRQAGYLEDATAPTEPTDSDTRLRYSRSVELFRWMDLAPDRSGWDTQRLLADSSMVVVGLGGVGCPAAQILVRSGVGHVHCIDREVVDLSNLNRQPLFTDADISKPKAEVGVRRLREHNPGVEVTGEVLDVSDPGQLQTLAERFDVVLLAADRPQDIRSWTNQACLATGTPWVYGGYHGPLISVGAFRPGTGACFDCGPADNAARSMGPPGLTDWAPGVGVEQPHAADATNCTLAGVFTARLALSLRTGVPHLPTPCHLAFNLVTMREHAMAIRDAPSPHCPTCGPQFR